MFLNYRVLSTGELVSFFCIFDCQETFCFVFLINEGAIVPFLILLKIPIFIFISFVLCLQHDGFIVSASLYASQSKSFAP